MYETILVPTDGSDGAVAAGERAIDLALAGGGTLHVLYVVDVRMSPVSADMDHEAVVELLDASDRETRPTTRILELADEAGVPAVEAIRVGVPHACIREYVADEGIDLIAMGTHGRTGLSHALLGSVAERVVRTSDVPVLTVPTPA
jgi:nucleotide-binding universal stress UspA family protein